VSIDKVVYLLTFLVLVFTGLLIYVAKTSPNDGQTFQIVSGLVTGFSGALLMRINPKKLDDPPGHTITMQETGSPKEK